MKILKIVIVNISILVFLFILVPYLFGYKIVYLTKVNYDYQAIGAIGQWVGAIIPIFLVFLSAYITEKINKAKNDITTNNTATVDYINDMIRDLNKKIEAIEGRGLALKHETEEEILNQLKSKALKYVSISGVAKTQKIADHLNVSREEAFDILNELMRVDGKISCGGRASKDNIDNVLWIKKKS